MPRLSVIKAQEISEQREASEQTNMLISSAKDGNDMNKMKYKATSRTLSKSN